MMNSWKILSATEDPIQFGHDSEHLTHHLWVPIHILTLMG